MPLYAWAHFAVRILVGASLGIAALSKLFQPTAFLAIVYDYGIVGPPWGRLVAILLPSLELLLCYLLLLNTLARAAFSVATGLCVAFTLAQASILARGMSVACGCFSISESQVIDKLTFARTAALALLAWIGFVLSKHRVAAV